MNPSYLFLLGVVSSGPRPSLRKPDPPRRCIEECPTPWDGLDYVARIGAAASQVSSSSAVSTQWMIGMGGPDLRSYLP